MEQPATAASPGEGSPELVIAGRPQLDAAAVRALMRDLYGKDVFEADIKELVSYDDQNFRISDSAGPAFVLKISNKTEQLELLTFQSRLLCHLQEHAATADVSPAFRFPLQHATLDGALIGVTGHPDRHYVRLLTYLDGIPYSLAKRSHRLHECMGAAAGSLLSTLLLYDGPSIERPAGTWDWDLRSTLRILRTAERLKLEKCKTDLLATVFDLFETAMQSHLCADGSLRIPCTLRTSVIHGDINNHNVLVNINEDGNVANEPAGIIDFGDVNRSFVVFEAAIGAAYVAVETETPLNDVCVFLSSFTEACPILSSEARLLFSLMLARLAVSVVMAERQLVSQPSNAYAASNAKPGWWALAFFAERQAFAADRMYRAAGGL